MYNDKKWSKKDKDWFERYSLAKKYYEENGNLKVPASYSCEKDGIKINLGTWISTQRIDYNSGKLPYYRKELLDEIGMFWKLKSNFSWDYMYEEAVNYYKEKGNLKVPILYSYIKDGEKINLGTWISTQRVDYNSDKLPQYRKELLDRIEMLWKLKNKYSWEYIYIT